MLVFSFISMRAVRWSRYASFSTPRRTPGHAQEGYRLREPASPVGGWRTTITPPRSRGCCLPKYRRRWPLLRASVFWLRQWARPSIAILTRPSWAGSTRSRRGPAVPDDRPATGKCGGDLFLALTQSTTSTCSGGESGLFHYAGQLSPRSRSPATVATSWGRDPRVCRCSNVPFRLTTVDHLSRQLPAARALKSRGTTF